MNNSENTEQQIKSDKMIVVKEVDLTKYKMLLKKLLLKQNIFLTLSALFFGMFISAGILLIELYASSSKKVNIYACDNLTRAYLEQKEAMVNGITNSSNGLMGLFVEPENFGRYSTAFQTLKKISDGEQINLSKEERKTLVEYGNKIGIELLPNNMGSNQYSANLALEQISLRTYEHAEAMLPTYSEMGILPNKIKSLEPFMNTLSSLQALQNNREIVENTYKNVDQVIRNADGSIKDEFEGIAYLGKTAMGTPIYDLTNLNVEQKENLEEEIPGEFKYFEKPLDKLNKKNSEPFSFLFIPAWIILFCALVICICFFAANCYQKYMISLASLLEETKETEQKLEN